jgi:phosphoribosylpyrophosphate synthetase
MLDGLLPPLSDIVLVDDIVTRGSTMLGAASRLAETFSGVRITAFAAMRTVSNHEEFSAIRDPRIGRIWLREDGESFRDP